MKFENYKQREKSIYGTGKLENPIVYILAYWKTNIIIAEVWNTSSDSLFTKTEVTCIDSKTKSDTNIINNHLQIEVEKKDERFPYEMRHSPQ